MNPQLIHADQKNRAPKVPFRLGEVRRILALVWPYRRTLAVGLLFTVLFAGLHTAGISGAFPVLKILLEPEGLQGWADRTIASARLGGTLSPVDRDGNIEILEVDPGGALERAGLSPREQLTGDDGKPAGDLVSKAAWATGGAALPASVLRDGAAERIELHPAEPTPEIRLLQWAVSLVPPDTQHDKMRVLMNILIVLVIVAVTANVFRYFGEVLIAQAILRGIMDLRARLYERTLHLPLSFFSGQSTSDIVTRFVQDTQEIQRGLITILGKFIREPLRAVFILGWAFILDWRITLTMALAAPVAVAVFWSVGRAVKTAARKLLQTYGMMIGALMTSFQSLRVVKSYTAEAEECERLKAVDRSVFRHQLRLVKLRAFVSPMMETVGIVAGSLGTVWLFGRVMDHELSLARFGTLGIALAILFDPLRKLSDVWVRVQRSTAGAERVFQVLDQPIETTITDHPIEPGPLADCIEFVGVTFTYPGATAPALRDINLTVTKGETLALVGPNGSGKTTLVSMLPRFFDPDSGEIRYDGIDIRRLNLKRLRRNIGLVSQDAVVFEASSAANITYGQPHADNGRVQDAARRAWADEFIREIPGGYEGILGERGSTLSGGQRQRLAIARAVYHDAPILIFDEATSQVDSESELKIQKALREFSKDRTTLIVAHRLSTIQFADRIVVMESGRIIDQGNHAALAERCTLYRTLCETQFAGESI